MRPTAERQSAGLIDSQSVRTADTVPAATKGFDAGKKVKGRKRLLVTDTLGLLVAIHVVAASVQDRDGAKRSLLWTRLDHPQIRKIWAGQGFASRLLTGPPRCSAASWTSSARILASVASRSSPSAGRSNTFSWLTAHRRLARDYETSPARSETMIRWAAIGLMVRRPTRGRPATRQGPRPLAREVS
ncbi:transposase [Streptomyces sp. NPDC004074]|uniref:transposase n=1 Tax=unclassified Streptomyces TaxID=2593676 RepID=UPI0033BF11FD